MTTEQRPDPQEGIGCRGVALTAIAFVLIAVAVWTVGLVLGRPDTCTGLCEWGSFTLLFAAGPVSAIFTVIGGTDLVVGWPIDMIAWLLLGTLHQRLSGEAAPGSRPWARWVVLFMGVAVAYGGVMALFVSRVR